MKQRPVSVTCSVRKAESKIYYLDSLWRLASRFSNLGGGGWRETQSMGILTADDLFLLVTCFIMELEGCGKLPSKNSFVIYVSI